jgi:hypothetical protein
MQIDPYALNARSLVDLQWKCGYNAAGPDAVRRSSAARNKKRRLYMAKSKIYSVRVDEKLATDLERFADVDGIAVAEQMRRAIELLLESRRKDPEFRERVRSAVERSQRLLKELGEPEMSTALNGVAASKEGASKEGIAGAREHALPKLKAARAHH